MEYLWYIVGGVVLFVLAMIPGLKSHFTNKKVTNALEANKKDDKKLEEDVKLIEHKEIGLGIQEAKVDQKLESLDNQKISSKDIADFINSLEKKDSK
jgi:hypothetical protein